MNETVPTLFAVALGGALGSMLRFRLRFITSNAKIPMGTLPGNIIASFILGLVTALFADAFFAVQSWQSWFYPFLTIGLAGALSTFSSLALEMHQITMKHGWKKSVGYASLTFVTGLIALSLGIFMGTSVPV
jgi:CrcB protein